LGRNGLTTLVENTVGVSESARRPSRWANVEDLRQATLRTTTPPCEREPMASRNDDTAVGEWGSCFSQPGHRRGRGSQRPVATLTPPRAGEAQRRDCRRGGRERRCRPARNTSSSERMGLGRSGLTTLAKCTVGVGQSAWRFSRRAKVGDPREAALGQGIRPPGILRTGRGDLDDGSPHAAGLAAVWFNSGDQPKVLGPNSLSERRHRRGRGRQWLLATTTPACVGGQRPLAATQPR
jgi:hypothetical protein